MSDERRLPEADDRSLEDRLSRLSWPVERGVGWAGIQARALEEEGVPSGQLPATASGKKEAPDQGTVATPKTLTPEASAPKARSRLRVAVYASLGVVLLAAVGVGAVMAAKYLGEDRSVLVIDDGTLEPAVTGGTSQPATTTSAVGTGDEASGLYPVSVDGKWGFIDKTGAIRVEPQFEAAEAFSEGLARVGVAEDGGMTWGYIDLSGTVVIPARFAYAEDFSEGLAVVGEMGEDGIPESPDWGADITDGSGSARRLGDSGNPSACGYIDTSGTLVIPMEYDGAGGFRDGLAQVWDADGCSFIDKTGTVVAGPYRLAFAFSEGLAYADDGSRQGFIDTNGNWAAVLESAAIDMSSYLSSLSYFPGSAQGFSEGLMALQATSGESPPRMGTADKGYVDKTGAWVIEPRFNYACDFSEGLAAVAVRENEFSGLKWGFIDKTGAWVIEPRFECAERFVDGMAVVGATVGGYMSFGYIDKTGTVVIPTQYRQAGDFSGGIAQVVSQSDSYSGSLSYIDTSGAVIWPSGSGATSQLATTTSAEGTGDETSELYPVSVGGKWGFIDNTGSIVIEPQFDIMHLPRPDYISDGFSDGLAMVGAGEANEEKWGYVDKTGVWVVQPQFEFVHHFSDGMAMVAYHTRDLPLIGFVDTTGALVIPIQYGLLTEGFSEGLCLVSLDGEAKGYIDKTGAVVIEPDPAFGYIADFHEGLAAVQRVDDPAAFGYIDTNGAWVMGVPSGLAPGSRGGFSEGLAVVYKLESVVSEDRCGFIDGTGAVVIEPQFSWALEFSEGLAAVAVGENEAEKWGFIDQTGAWVIEPQFSSALEFSEGLAAVAVGENEAQRWGFVDRTGAWVIEPQYESACSFTGGIAFVGDSSWPTYIDKTGKVIWQGE